MTKERMEAIWSAIKELLRVAEQTNREAELSYRALKYSFEDAGNEKFSIKAQLEGDQTYFNLTCSKSAFSSGKLFTGEEFVDLEKGTLRDACEQLFPEGVEEELLAKARRISPTPSTQSVLDRIAAMREKHAAVGRVGMIKPKI